MTTLPRLIIDDTFENGVQELPTLSGNGTVTEVGGQLVITVSAGQSANWWTSGRPGILAYAPFELRDTDQIIEFETELAYITPNPSPPGDRHQMWGLYLNDQNFYMIYTHDGLTWASYQNVGNSWTYLAQYTGSPVAGLPVKIRFVWDRGAKTLSFQIYDLGAWQEIHNLTPAFNPASVFFYNKNYGGLPAIETKYNYVKAEVTQEFSLSKTEPAVIEEVGGPVSAGGPPTHQVEFSQGQLMPGPTQQQLGSVGPFPSAGFEDQHPIMDLQGGDEASLMPSTLQEGYQDRASYRLFGESIESSSGGGVEDAESRKLGSTVQFNPFIPTYDNEGHQHLLGYHIDVLFCGDCTPEPWHQPTVNNFTGYARNGKKYISGVEDPGPVYSPWAAETASSHRSSRTDFPVRYAIAVSRQELVIYDLDNFPSTLDVWMRFNLGNSVWNMIGRNYSTIKDVFMLNGVLYVVLTSSSENGGLITIDFKRDGETDSVQLVRSDGQWRWNTPTYNITNRNDANYWTSNTGIRLQNEQCFSVAVGYDPQDLLWDQVWVAIGGEDNFEVIEFIQNTPNRDYPSVPDVGPYNIGSIRHVAIGHDGVLWMMQQDGDDAVLWRNGYDYRGGVVVNPVGGVMYDTIRKRRHPIFRIPRVTGTSLASARNYLYVGTDVGVYQVSKTDVQDRSLAFTITGGSGGGPFDNPPAGEVIVGEKAEVNRLRVFNAQKSSYLTVATNPGEGGVTVIRLYDGYNVHSRVYDSLDEDGAFSGATITVP